MNTPDNELIVSDSTLARNLALKDIQIGQAVKQTLCFDKDLWGHFDVLACDQAPLHTELGAANNMGFDAPVIQGLAVSSRFSRLIGMYLPGSRAVLEKIDFQFKKPTYPGQVLTYRCEVKRVFLPLRVVQLELSMRSEDGLNLTGSCQCVLR